MTVAFHTCPFCEATCGLEVTVHDGEVQRVRGDAEDVFSHGFLCPKGVSLKELHADPDRLRTPVLRQEDGTFAPCSWDEAFARIDVGLGGVLAAGDRDAVGVYLGNPSAHHLGPLLYGRVFLKALGSKNIFSASTVDQYPKQMASALLFGSGATVAIPDLDRCSHLLVLGANPLASNGSLMTAPDVRGRLKAIQDRGGKIVVVDPRRSRTAQVADEHVPIRPGTDALLLFAMAHTLFAEELVDTRGLPVSGLDEVRELAEDFPPDEVAAATGIHAETIRRMARELASAPQACVYGRIGTTTQEFGTLASWLVDVLNLLTGNLDRPGGAMFPLPAVGAANAKGVPGRGRGARFGRWTSRVRGLGEIFGELPVACLAEEIETDGPGRIRAMVTVAGNPVVSTPNSERLDAALASLDFMVSLDMYVTETSRHADVILPAPSPLERPHFPIPFYGFAIRNVANWSEPLFDGGEAMPDEWVSLLRLTGIVTGQGADADVAAIDDFVALEMARRETTTEGSPVLGRDPADVIAEIADPQGKPRRGPERLVDLMLRTGPYSLDLAALEAAPHGIDLGPLEPRMPGVLRTASGTIELAPDAIVGDVPRLRQRLAAVAAPDSLVLVGRRHLRSNNSWMHNLPVLVRGPERCTAHVNPEDAERLGLVDGDRACVRSRVGEVEIGVEVTADIMRGVVSIPHGWGHDAPGVSWRTAAAHAGTNSNVLTDESLVDALSGTAVLNGIPVTVAPVRVAVAAD